MLDPCFGRIALKLGVMICAGIKIGLEFIGMLSCCGSLYSILDNYCPIRSNWCSRPIEHFFIKITAYILVILILIVLVVSDVVLIVAAMKRNTRLCKVWLMVTLVCSVLEFLVNEAMLSAFDYRLAAGVTHTLFFSYAVIVVLSFVEQLKNEETALSASEAVEPAPGDSVYGQPSQSQSVGQEPPPSYDRPSKANVA